jgi:hypothetical protein
MGKAQRAHPVCGLMGTLRFAHPTSKKHTKSAYYLFVT